jgi:hypothetical protein
MALLRMLAIGLGAALISLASPASSGPIDLQLVLAVDTSGSIDGEEFGIQRGGYAAAFRDPEVTRAVSSGSAGIIAVTFVEWSSTNEQRQMVGWTLLHDADSCEQFARAIEHSRRTFSDSTSVAGAIDFSARLLRRSGFESERRIIDISGDGINNQGRDVRLARDEAVAAGITINGLAIRNEEPILDRYFRENVIGGAGAFVVAVEDFSTFAEAIRAKLVAEIAGTSQPRKTEFAHRPMHAPVASILVAVTAD